VNTTRITIAVARPVKLEVPRGRPLHPVAAVRAVLQTLVDWACHERSLAAIPMTHAQEARAVREYALKFSRADPRFAAELCAAADRHEIGESA